MNAGAADTIACSAPGFGKSHAFGAFALCGGLPGGCILLNYADVKI